MTDVVLRAERVLIDCVEAYPDGGIARARALGTPTEEGMSLLRQRWEESA